MKFWLGEVVEKCWWLLLEARAGHELAEAGVRPLWNGLRECNVLVRPGGTDLSEVGQTVEQVQVSYRLFCLMLLFCILIYRTYSWCLRFLFNILGFQGSYNFIALNFFMFFFFNIKAVGENKSVRAGFHLNLETERLFSIFWQHCGSLNN